MKVKFTLSIGFPGAKRSDILDLEDDTSDDEIEEVYQQWCQGYMDGGWEKGGE